MLTDETNAARAMSSIDTNVTTHPDLLPGALDLLILRTLQSGALHG